MNPLGLGFRLTRDDLDRLGIDETNLPANLKPYMIGRDIVRRHEKKWVIDFSGMSVNEAKLANPQLFQHILTHVKPERDQNRRKTRRENWWLFGENAPTLRKGLASLDRMTATCRTARHRIFVLLPARTIPDAKIVGIALDDTFSLGVLSSKIHRLWADETGGWLGAGNDSNYNHADCFGKFPFPATDDEALKARIREAAEALDGLRKQVLERHEDLTLTRLYNTLEALRTAEAAGGALSEAERDIAERGCVSLIREHHDTIDAGVAEAYGWEDLLKEKSSPSTGSGRTEWVEGADEAILERLVALNAERAAEEKAGLVRWLRPEFQAPDYVPPAEQTDLDYGEAAVPVTEALAWPAALPEQVVAVAGVVERAAVPVAANDVARAFQGKRAASVTRCSMRWPAWGGCASWRTGATRRDGTRRTRKDDDGRRGEARCAIRR